MTRRAALQEAARWAMREDEGVLTEEPPVVAKDLQRMLEDPALGEALASVAAVGRLSDEEVRAMRARRSRALGAGAATILVALVGFGTLRSGIQSAPPGIQHIETARGEQRTVRLADGSTIELAGATSVDVALDDDLRTVELRHGEAYFDVAHDGARPFLVRAGKSSTRVLGTAFSVDVGQTAVRLSVYRGKVRFADRAGMSGGVVVPAGWRSSFARGVAMAPSRFDGIRMDRRQPWIDTDEMVLGELVEELNRRSGPVIAPLPPQLADLPLSGRFKLNDPEELLGAIGEVYGFGLARDGDTLRIVAGTDDIRKSSN